LAFLEVPNNFERGDPWKKVIFSILQNPYISLWNFIWAHHNPMKG